VNLLPWHDRDGCWRVDNVGRHKAPGQCHHPLCYEYRLVATCYAAQNTLSPITIWLLTTSNFNATIHAILLSVICWMPGLRHQSLLPAASVYSFSLHSQSLFVHLHELSFSCCFAHHPDLNMCPISVNQGSRCVLSEFALLYGVQDTLISCNLSGTWLNQQSFAILFQIHISNAFVYQPELLSRHIQLSTNSKDHSVWRLCPDIMPWSIIHFSPTYYYFPWKE